MASSSEGSAFINLFAPDAISRSVDTILPEEIHDVAGCIVIQEDKNMYLVHVMSGVRVRLPNHEPSYLTGIDKMVLSTSPLTNSVNYTLMIAYNNGYLAYWNPGDKTFTEIDRPLVCDVIFYNGFFYGVTSYGWLLAIKRCTSHPTATLGMKRSQPVLPSCLGFTGQHITYLVECDGDLLLVIRFEGEVDSLLPKMLRMWGYRERPNAIREQRNEAYFRVYKIEIGRYRSRLIEMESLGNRALFVGGFSASFSVNTSEIPGCKPNHIYFTGHLHRHKAWRYREKHHMRVYSLQDGLIETSVCDNMKSNEVGCTCGCPPLWVTPTLV